MSESKSHALASICADAEETMFPSWYATPGNVPRNAGGEISERKIGMTPHAPWTPTWMQNAPAERPLNVFGRIHNGMNAPISRQKITIVSLLPMYWLVNPAIAPPAMAPQLPMMVALVAARAEKPFVVSRYVGKRSCEPCERKLKTAITV